MENRINIAELLKDCPKGMELDCTIWDNCTFEGIEDVGYINILVKTPNGLVKLSKEGYLYHNQSGSKCVIFPKGKTTWEGFVPPCQFNDGDVLSYKYGGFKNHSIYIYMQHNIMNTSYYVALSGDDGKKFMINNKKGVALNGYNDSVRFATEEEKEKLFQAIKENGYKWNAETKTLEKLKRVILPELNFKVGTIVQDREGYKVKIIAVDLEAKRYRYESVTTKGIGGISFENQYDWELVSNKFDFSALVPFESRVLVRDNEQCEWLPAVYGYTDDLENHCVVGGYFWKYLIPYENNEHLCGTNNDCDEFYKTWED